MLLFRQKDNRAPQARHSGAAASLIGRRASDKSRLRQTLGFSVHLIRA